MKPTIAVTLLALVVACSNRDNSASTSAKGSGSGTGAGANASLPKEDMVSIAAGRYALRELAFAPEADGRCPAATFARVEGLRKVLWPDASQQVGTFTIDKHAVSCDDYRSCVRAK